jgi:hypothetical protein
MHEDDDTRHIKDTDGDAATCKLSCTRLGYFDDEYIPHLVANCPPRLPILNYGYYIRVSMIRRMTRALVDCVGAHPCQVVSLGAGSDTHGFWSLGQFERMRYFEVDFSDTILFKAKKLDDHRTKFWSVMGASHDAVEPHFSTSPSSDRVVWSLGRFAMVGFDLRDDPRVLLEILTQSTGFDNTRPTLIISECCLIYLDSSQCESILSAFASVVSDCTVCLYEQINGDDEFGKIMIGNLSRRGCPLRSILPDIGSHVTRLTNAGFTVSRAESLEDVTGKILTKRIELIDEWEEFNLLQRHYVFAVGSTFGAERMFHEVFEIDDNK